MGATSRAESELFSKTTNRAIRGWMDIRGENLVSLADKTGISKSKLSRTVYRSEGSLTVRDLSLICNALDINVLEVIESTV